MSTPRRLAVLVLVAVVAVAAACGNRGDVVAVVGDSITALDQGSLEEQLGGDYQLQITGNFGKTVAEVLPEATAMVAKDPAQVIVNLGTNDVLQDLPVDSSMSSMQQMVDLFPDARCIHLVNINEHMVVQDTDTSRADQASAFNAALDQLAERNDRVDIIDWNEVAAGALNDAQPPTSTLTVDSIHPTEDGNTELNQLYRSALADCPRFG
jgi:lysophospholipase L1-like esterase